MAETVTAPPKPQQKTARDGVTDTRVLAQVEKWMETIRELSREPAKS